MAPPTIPPNANALEHRKADVIVDSCSFETVKYFITQTIIYRKIVSQKNSIATRTLKLDLMLSCFDQKLPENYQLCYMYITMLFM